MTNFFNDGRQRLQEQLKRVDQAISKIRFYKLVSSIHGGHPIYHGEAWCKFKEL
jgi:hypothetical protein